MMRDMTEGPGQQPPQDPRGSAPADGGREVLEGLVIPSRRRPQSTPDQDDPSRGFAEPPTPPGAGQSAPGAGNAGAPQGGSGRPWAASPGAPGASGQAPGPGGPGFQGAPGPQNPAAAPGPQGPASHPGAVSHPG